MQKKEIVAMILAGGQGSRLGTLTKNIAKPAVPFGGKYRIIDFTLSNCSNSGIDVIGVLTQYKPFELNRHIGIGSPWNLDKNNGGIYVLPPYMRENGGDWYKGTANAIYQNIDFIDTYNPEYVLVLSGDHIYKMNYLKMLEQHKKTGADVTIGVIKVPIKEASRFGIMNTDENNRIYGFEEKPKIPKSNLASMGIYIFSWKELKNKLIEDEDGTNSVNDFGKNIIPKMLNENKKLYAYSFDGYWKDVGTIQSLWQANMDMLNINNTLNTANSDWEVFSADPILPPQYISNDATVKNSIVADGCVILGEVHNSILFPGVHIGINSKIYDSVIMPNACIENNTIIKKSIIDTNAILSEGCIIGNDAEITVIGNDTEVKESAAV